MASIYESFNTESLNERAINFKDYPTHEGVNSPMASVKVYLFTP